MHAVLQDFTTHWQTAYILCNAEGTTCLLQTRRLNKAGGSEHQGWSSFRSGVNAFYHSGQDKAIRATDLPLRQFLNKEWQRQLATADPACSAVQWYQRHPGELRRFELQIVMASRAARGAPQLSQADSGGYLLTALEYFLHSLPSQVRFTRHGIYTGELPTWEASPAVSEMYLQIFPCVMQTAWLVCTCMSCYVFK